MLSGSGQATYLITDRQGIQYNTGGIAPFNPTSFGVSGNKTGYAFGPNYIDGTFDAAVIVVGQYNTNDPVWDPGTTVLGQIVPNLISDFARSLTAPLIPPYGTANVTPPAATIFQAGSQSARRDSHRLPDLGPGDRSPLAAQRQRRLRGSARRLHHLGRLGQHFLRRCQRQYQPLEYRLHHSGAVGYLVIGQRRAKLARATSSSTVPNSSVRQVTSSPTRRGSMPAGWATSRSSCGITAPA